MTLFLGTLSPRSSQAVKSAIEENKYTTQMVITHGERFRTMNVITFQRAIEHAFECIKQQKQIELKISNNGLATWKMNHLLYTVNTEFVDALIESGKKIGMYINKAQQMQKIILTVEN